MKKTLLLMLIPAALQAQLIAQKYFTFGAGYSETIYNSTTLDLFKEEYNVVNRPALIVPLDGFGSAEGVRLEIGYRRVARWGLGLLTGAQFDLSRDGAAFGNGESRDLVLKMSTLFVSYEMGRTWDRIFLNGVCTLYFNRGFTLESDYKTSRVDTTVANKVLTGEYKTSKSFSTDVGIAFGIHKQPMFIVARITYPIFTGGRKNALVDDSRGKIAAGFETFPAEYINFVLGNKYKPIAGNVDGLKIVITAAFAIRLK